MSLQESTNINITIRRLGISDAKNYRELRLHSLSLHPESFGASYEEELAMPLSWFEERLMSNAVFGGYSDKYSLIGMAGFFVQNSYKSSHKGVLWGMFVSPEARGKGLAKLLTETVVDHAKGIVEEILLTVVTSNTPAVKLYKEIGFKEYGLETRALKIKKNYHDELLMSLILENSR